MIDKPKLCECGCGKKTKMVKRNNSYLGIKKGDSNRFIHGHNNSTFGKRWKVKDTSDMHHPIFKKGTKFSEEHKKHMRENHKGALGKHWKLSDEAKKNISKSKKGKHLSPSTEFKKGHKHTEEVKRKMREKRAKQILPKKDTSIEIKIQNFLKQLGIEFFTHQHMKEIEHSYQCDILIPSMNLVIECDGNYWHKYPIGLERDHIRTKELIEKGFKVLRLWEHEIRVMELNDFEERLRV